MTYLRKDCIYHIYNRGNRKTKICIDNSDYDYIKNLLLCCFLRQSFDILAYCIMPNHYHILVAKIRNPTVSHSMQLFGAAYTRYFNKKYNLVGHLFQGTYKYKTIKTANQLFSTAEYIAKNPIGLSKRRYLWVYRNHRLTRAYALILF